MNPLLIEWLDDYQTAAALYHEETRYLHVDQLVPPRPPEMQFTITSTGLLRNHAGAKMGHVSEMSPLDLRNIGVDHTRLTARQRRTPMPRRNPDTTRQISTTTPAEPGTSMHDVITATAAANGVRLDLTGIPDGAIQPLTHPAAERTWDHGLLNTMAGAAAAPGDVVTRDGERVGTVGLNGRGEAVVLSDPNPMHDRLRRPSVNTDAVLDNLHTAYAGATTLPNPIDLSRLAVVDEVAGVHYDRISNAVNNLSATMSTSREAALNALSNLPAMTLPPELEPEVYVGPRMLATIAQPAASAERYAQHTADAEHAHLRAGQIFHQRPMYRAAVRRATEDAPNGTMVDRNAAAVTTFLSEGYGLELNEEALSAVTAMTNYLMRQAVIPLQARAERAEETANTQRMRADALMTNVNGLEARLQTMTDARDALRDAVTTGTDPGPVEAATAAAKAWKQTGHGDSVAKLASFKHLLDTLDRLAQ